MTPQQIQAILNKYIGKSVEAEDPSNIDQCFDWAFKYCDEIGIDRAAIRHMYAFQIFALPNDLTLKYFDYIPNTPNGVPVLGDIVVFKATPGNIAGHVSVVEKADTNQITSTDQNWNGHKYVERINHPYDNVLGWLHPKSTQPVPQPTPSPISDDEGRALQVLKDHVASSSTKDGHAFGNLEGYANTLVQDCYNAWRNPPPQSANLTPRQEAILAFLKGLGIG